MAASLRFSLRNVKAWTNRPALCASAISVVGSVAFVADGEVSAGRAVVHLSAEQSDGSRTPFLDLDGQLEDGRLDAVGSFADGRTATLNWRKAIAPSR